MPRSRGNSTHQLHAEWLRLLRPDGPFLALPVLAEVFPHGLEAVPDETRSRVRQAWTELSEAPDQLNDAWQEFILGDLLRYHASMLSDAATSAGDFTGPTPDSVLCGPKPSGGHEARLYIYRRGFGDELTRSIRGEPSLAERAAQVCRDNRVPLALLTNGQIWVLVRAKPGEPTTIANFDADLWFEEPELLNAFTTLLGASRVLPPPADAQGEPSTSLAGLFVRSAAALEHVTTTLGEQVRQAVELLVGELARLDRESAGTLLAEVSERDIYRAALTVLMRVVFLLYAEEQRLLPVTDEVYAEGYAVLSLFDTLEEDRNRHGDEIGDRRRAAWPRLLALFRAVHGGCEHPDLRVPAHGGSLFDPGAFPWLERAEITDRVIREILDALLTLKHRGQAPERLSYRGLDVEQIGHMYEGLLEFSCRKVTEPYVGLLGKNEPEVALSELESVAAQGDERFRAWVRQTCGVPSRRLENALSAEPGIDQVGALHAACDNDAGLAERIAPFWSLLRLDLRGEPTVFPAGSVVFTQVGDRRSTGTHYTPRSLAEEIVEHTLAPLCFAPGPADGADRADWRAKSAEDLLKLKVVDPAMGSGAFLVSACRYLSQRIVEAWQRDGVPDDIAESLNDPDDDEGQLLAARRLVAARCLYGVDRDDMAVELAKLSLWLVTLARNKPFDFVDHALRCGDSLVGLVRTDQLRYFHLDPQRGREVNSRMFGVLDDIESVLLSAAKLRHRIEATVAKDHSHVEEKAVLLAEADQITARLRLAADAVVGAALSTAGSDSRYDDRLSSLSDDLVTTLSTKDSPAEPRLRGLLTDWLRGSRPEPIRPFHWPLEFPEVMEGGDFDAAVSNPPFIGGKRVSGALGSDVREYLKERIANDKPGNADLCSYFLLRDVGISSRGRAGIIATKTIAQGDTREVGLDQICHNGQKVYRAIKSQKWPGTASVVVSLVWVGHASERETINLDGRIVRAITSSLDPESRVSGNPQRLAANANKSFQGCIVLGMGFVVENEIARNLVLEDDRNKEVLFPYLNGEDLNSRSDCSASRWVIDFNDWPIERASEYEEVFSIVDEKVRPERQRVKSDGSYVLRNPLPQRWWQYADKRPALRAAVAGLDRVLVLARVSSTAIATFVSSRQIFHEKIVVFASDDPTFLALLNSQIHIVWAWRHSSTLKSDL